MPPSSTSALKAEIQRMSKDLDKSRRNVNDMTKKLSTFQAEKVEKSRKNPSGGLGSHDQMAWIEEGLIKNGKELDEEFHRLQKEKKQSLMNLKEIEMDRITSINYEQNVGNDRIIALMEFVNNTLMPTSSYLPKIIGEKLNRREVLPEVLSRQLNGLSHNGNLPKTLKLHLKEIDYSKLNSEIYSGPILVTDEGPPEEPHMHGGLQGASAIFLDKEALPHNSRSGMMGHVIVAIKAIYRDLTEEEIFRYIVEIKELQGSLGMLTISEIIDRIAFLIVNGTHQSSKLLACCICMNELWNPEMSDTESSTTTIVKLPGCAHLFHPGCIQQWLSTKPECPLCRKLLDFDECQLVFKFDKA